MAIEKYKVFAPENTTSSKTGSTLVKVGAGGGILWLAAGFLPFITLPMLLVAAVIAGLLLY